MCPPQAQAPLQQQQQPTLLTEGALLSGEKPQAGGRLHRLFQRVRTLLQCVGGVGGEGWTVGFGQLPCACACAAAGVWGQFSRPHLLRAYPEACTAACLHSCPFMALQPSGWARQGYNEGQRCSA